MSLITINWFCHEKTKFKLTTNYYFDNIWMFDLNCKFNGFISMGKYLNLNLNIFFSIPLVPFVVEGLSRIWIILNSSKICKFFSFQNTTVKKLITILKKNKWITIAVIQTKIWAQKSKIIFSELILTILPYLWFSTTLKIFWLFSDNTGGISFFFNEISFFSNFLDEHFIGWNKTIIVSLQLIPILNKIKMSKYIKFFFCIPFIFNMVAWIIWSSFGFCCYWGHSGWLPTNFIKNLAILNFNKLNHNFKKYYY